VKKNKGATAPTWTKFEEVYPSEGKLGEHETMWQNRFYVVVRKYLQETHEGAIHLSIRLATLSENQK
jgi:hypothetical protein